MGYSIGKVFRPIEEEMHKYAKVDSLYLPVPNYSAKGLWKNIRAARVAIKKKKYDIVHITGAEHYLIPFLKGQRVVVTVHDLGFCTILKHKISYRLKYYLFVSSLKKAALVTFISEKTERETLEYVKLKKGQYVTIPNPVGMEFQFYKKTFNSECPVILQIGTKKHKNLDRSIEALKGIRCHFRIIGEVSDGQEKRMKEYGIQHSAGINLSDEEILKEYRNADIINFPSLYEGFGMPVIEGQATGRVVITSDLEPMTEIAGGAAILVNPNDTQSMHDAYLRTMDENVRREVIAKGTKNVQRFQLKDIAYRYFSAYSKTDAHSIDIYDGVRTSPIKNGDYIPYENMSVKKQDTNNENNII